MDNVGHHSLTPARTQWITLLVAATFFMENLDATVIATAIPQMAHDFSVSPIALNTGISAYLLAVAIFIPLSGWLADRFSERRVFAAAILLFTFASLLCGLSDSLPMFIASRVLQGIGGALMVPVGRLLAMRITRQQDLVRTIALITWPGLIAPVLGPPLGGIIATHGHWPWIFWLNIPLGIVALLATFWLIPAGSAGAPRPFDTPGFLLTGIACAALITGLEWLGQGQMLHGALLLVLGTGCAWWAWRHSLNAEHPMLSWRAMAIDSFRITLVGGSLFRAAINAIPFLLPLMFQLSFGLSATEAGMLVLWVFAGNLAMKPMTTALMRRYGFRRVLLANGLISAAGIAVCALITPQWPWPLLAAVLFIGGMSRSMQFTAYNTLGFAEVPKAEMSGASTLFSMFFQFSTSAGIAFAALALRASMTFSDHAEPQAGDFGWAFIAVSVLSLLGMIDSLGLKPGTGEQVLQRKA